MTIVVPIILIICSAIGVIQAIEEKNKPAIYGWLCTLILSLQKLH